MTGRIEPNCLKGMNTPGLMLNVPGWPPEEAIITAEQAEYCLSAYYIHSFPYAQSVITPLVLNEF